MGASADSRRHVTDDPAAVDDSACTVLHVDMDAFFAFVELRRHPELRHRPMMVAGTSGRSVVLSATYPARAAGVRSGMPLGRAKTLCPGIAVVPPDHALYYQVSRQVMAIFSDFTPLVEPLSVDEAFLDVSGAGRTGGRPGEIAVALRRRIRQELQLTATVGASSTKFVAKLASGLAKPDGLLIVPPQDAVGLLHPLSVRALWGVGPAVEKSLRALGLSTVGEIAHTDRDWLIRRLGAATGGKLHDLAWAKDDRSVTTDVSEASIGAETTFVVDSADIGFLRRELLALADRTARRARAAGQRGRTVAIKVRYDDFTTLTRSVTLDAPTDMARTIHAAAITLLDRLGPVRRVRLVGVRLDGLTEGSVVSEQLAFDDGERRPGWRAAETTVDQISARFGATAMGPASLLGRTSGRSTAGQQAMTGRESGAVRRPAAAGRQENARNPAGEPPISTG
ncbi:MAG: DNA polymerase IV [Actinomycetota bacterium]|nr:DNA polymerase IV [Actinomycetota bacterium]